MFLVTVTHSAPSSKPTVYSFPLTMYSAAHEFFKNKCETFGITDQIEHNGKGYEAVSKDVSVTFMQEQDPCFQLTVKEPNGDTTIFHSKSPVRAAHKFNTEIMRLKLSPDFEEKGETILKMENGYHLEYKKL